MRRSNKLGVMCVFSVAMCAFAASFLLPEWRDFDMFLAETLELDLENRYRFDGIRDRHLGWAFLVRDYSLTTAIPAGVVWVCSVNRATLSGWFAKKWVRWLLVLFMPILCLAGIAVMLELGHRRYEYPTWADTLIIPFVGGIFLSLAVSAVLLVHALFFDRTMSFSFRSPIWRTFTNVWLQFLRAVSACVLLITAFFGDWSGLPFAVLLLGFFWSG